MSDDTIFNDDQTKVVVEPPKPPVLPDHLKELVGEGKKYASVEKALESIPHAQGHISKLETELAELRQKAAEAKAAEEVYAKLMETMNKAGEATPPSAGLDEASVAAIFDKRLQEKEAAAIAAANVSRVKDALVKKYGEKAQEIYAAKAEELGVGVQFLNDVVRKSPKAAEELFGIKPAPSGGGASTGSVRPDVMNNNRPQEPHPTVMGGATTEQLVSAWRAAKPT